MAMADLVLACQTRGVVKTSISLVRISQTPIYRGLIMFKVMFENSLLDILPASCFLVLASFRILQLWTKPRMVKQSAVYIFKLVWSSIFQKVCSDHSNSLLRQLLQ